ncbi:hypothetical protein [Enterococcus sp.]|uniref:hypothetical protein n=1 Tax=Enterococcus sp. TaxID=35783 RepID=UPI00290A6D90|nr:hypothetical protein [Enterococcus sp.]MDU5337152.1 hypothetical protein [Enterococcus sp.]
MAKKADYDLIDWIERDFSTRNDYKLREKYNLFILSEKSLKKYFHTKNKRKETLIRLTKIDPLNLHLASITLESAAISNPVKTLSFFSIIFTVVSMIYTKNNQPFFIMFAIMLILAVVGFTAHLSIGFDDISRLKLYIDKAIELQDKMEK